MTDAPQDKAMEAAARALSEDGFAEHWPHALRSAQAAIDAYLAAMEAEGFVMVPVSLDLSEVLAKNLADDCAARP